MEDVQIAPWLALVPAYVAIARLRGSSWRDVLLTPTLMLLGALIIFGVPPMWQIDGVRRVVVIIGAAAVATLAVWLVRRSPEPMSSRRSAEARLITMARR